MTDDDNNDQSADGVVKIGIDTVCLLTGCVDVAPGEDLYCSPVHRDKNWSHHNLKQTMSSPINHDC